MTKEALGCFNCRWWKPDGERSRDHDGECRGNLPQLVAGKGVFPKTRGDVWCRAHAAMPPEITKSINAESEGECTNCGGDVHDDSLKDCKICETPDLGPCCIIDHHCAARGGRLDPDFEEQT